MCNQVAGFSHCLTKVQENMAFQLRLIYDDKAKGKLSVKDAAEELSYLINFNPSITYAVARTVQCLSDFVFINMANITLARHDRYLEQLMS